MSFASILSLSLDLAKFSGLGKKVDLAKFSGLDKGANNVKNELMFGLGSSIKNQTKDLILQFPILCSDSLSLETMTILTKALEYDYSCKIGLAVNSLPASSKANTIDFLKQFHKNIYNDYLAENADVNSTQNSINKTNKKLMRTESIINTSSLNEASLPKYLREDLNNKDEEVKIITKSQPSINGKEIQALNDMNPTIIKAQVYFVVGNDGNDHQYRTNYTDNNTEIYIKNSNSSVISKDILFGVKSVIHPLKHEEVAYYLSDASKGSSLLFKFIRWTTGEIKFFRDIVLAIDVNKQLATDAVKNNSFWWKKLQMMSQDRKIRAAYSAMEKGDTEKAKALMKNAPLPITTMVISKTDIDTIYEKYGINILHDNNYAFKIQRQFFLMNFIIVDEASEIVYIFDENLKKYDHYSLNTLKPKKSGGTIDVKDLVPLLKR